VEELRNLPEQVGPAVWSFDSDKLLPISDLSRFCWATNERETVSLESNRA
jgi:hypothetical protein